jgi:hypothetical protein
MNKRLVPHHRTEGAMGGKRWRRPLMITDVEQPYWRKGLLYIPVRSFERHALLAAPPHVALEGAKRVTDAMRGGVVFQLPETDDEK